MDLSVGNGPVDIFAAGCAAVSAAAAIYVAMRDSRWRKSGLAKQLSDRISAAQTAADRWHETEPAKLFRSDIDRHAELLIRHGGVLENVATKTDIARLEGSVALGVQASRNAEASIDRIEGGLLKRALANT